jgi:hypothetical protein
MFQLCFGAVLLALFLSFWFWHSPMRRKLTPSEIDRFMGAIEKLPAPAGERGDTLARLRAWAERDDGKPVYMLNLMRYHRELRTFPGTPEFLGTPEQANEFYEKSVLSLLIRRAGYPMVGGKTQGKNLLQAPQDLDEWSRVLIVRYPSRRSFLSLVADSAYAPLEPYKFMAVEIVLVPVSGDVVVPDMRLVFGGVLLVVFLTAGWITAAWF